MNTHQLPENTPHETLEKECARMKRHAITSMLVAIFKICLAIVTLLAIFIFGGAAMDPAFTYQSAFKYWLSISASLIGCFLVFIIIGNILEFLINGDR